MSGEEVGSAVAEVEESERVITTIYMYKAMT